MASDSIDIIVRTHDGLTHFVAWIAVAPAHAAHSTLLACTRVHAAETQPAFLVSVGTPVTCLLCIQRGEEWRLTTKGIGNVLREMLELPRA